MFGTLGAIGINARPGRLVLIIREAAKLIRVSPPPSAFSNFLGIESDNLARCDTR
jgi:hypothetical protein